MGVKGFTRTSFRLTLAPLLHVHASQNPEKSELYASNQCTERAMKINAGVDSWLRTISKLAYIPLNHSTPCPPRNAVSVNQGRGFAGLLHPSTPSSHLIRVATNPAMSGPLTTESRGFVRTEKRPFCSIRGSGRLTQWNLPQACCRPSLILHPPSSPRPPFTRVRGDFPFPPYALCCCNQ